MRWRSCGSVSIAESCRIRHTDRRAALGAIALLPCALTVKSAHAGAQEYEPLADSVRTALAARIADAAPPERKFDRIDDRVAFVDWLAEMSQRMGPQEPDYRTRIDLLRTLDYECARA